MRAWYLAGRRRGRASGFSKDAPVDDLVGEEAGLQGDLKGDDQAQLFGGGSPSRGGRSAGARGHAPDDAGGDQGRGLKEKEQGVDPLLPGVAEAGMNPLVFGDKHTGERGESGVDGEVQVVEGLGGQPAKAGEEGADIQRMAYSLPEREVAFPVKMELVNQDDQPLKHKRKN